MRMHTCGSSPHARAQHICSSDFGETPLQQRRVGILDRTKEIAIHGISEICLATAAGCS